MIEITDEMVQSLETALEQSRRYDGEGGYFMDEGGFIAALTAVAPLIEAQVREQEKARYEGAVKLAFNLIHAHKKQTLLGLKPKFKCDGKRIDKADIEMMLDGYAKLVADIIKQPLKYVPPTPEELKNSEAQRTKIMEDRMAGEILRAMRGFGDGFTQLHHRPRLGDYHVAAELRVEPYTITVRGLTIPALHAAMVEAGMIGGDK